MAGAHAPDLGSLVSRLRPDERRSAGPLLVMAAEAVARDTPAFDKPKRKNGLVAGRIMQLAVEQPAAGPGAYARGARYLRWGGDANAARALLDAGRARFGDRPVLERAAARLP